jgi:hypothetical protein
MRLDPLPVHVPDDGLGGRPDNQRFFEFGCGIGLDAAALFGAKPVMGHEGALFREALDVLCFFGQKGLGYEERKVCVDVARGFEAGVKIALNALPDTVPMWLDDHASTDRGLVDQFSGRDHIEVPLRVVL